jgi:cytochrome c oxidase subunit 2
MRRPQLGALALSLLLTACAGNPPSILEPAGPGAREVESLWWPMLWISVAVFLVVGGMLVWAVVRARGADPGSLDRRHIGWGEPFIAIAGVFLPFLILAGTYVMSLRTMNSLASQQADSSLEIEVIGRDWWWEVRYPNGAVTANEIHIPVGRTVSVELTTKDVIHSFWVPELQVKTDQIPGQTSTTWLRADEPGRFRGQCAEFCGLQHANMIFYVYADPVDEFEEWMEREAADAVAAPDAVPGETIFLGSSCAGCHAIRGTEADANLGPDLTHLATRSSIGGAFPNTRDNLERFVTDPHRMKPGVAMPPSDLSAEEIRLLVDYLETLD